MELSNMTQNSQIISDVTSLSSIISSSSSNNNSESIDLNTVQQKANQIIGKYKDFPTPEWVLFIHTIRKISQVIISETPLNVKELTNTLFTVLNIILTISAKSVIDSAIFDNASSVLKEGTSIYFPPTVEGNDAYISLQTLSDKFKNISILKASVDDTLSKVLNSLNAAGAIEGVVQLSVSNAAEAVNKTASQMKAASTISAAQTAAINSVLNNVNGLVTLAKDKKWVDLIKRINEIVQDYASMKEFPTWIKWLVTAKTGAAAIKVVSGGKRLLHKKRRKTNRKRKANLSQLISQPHRLLLANNYREYQRSINRMRL
jgi:hypothetical protein